MWHWYMVVPFVLCVFVYVRQTDRFFQTHLDGIRFGRFAFPISFFLLFLGEIFAVEQFNTPYFLYMIIVLSLCIGLVVVLFYGEMERKILAVLIFGMNRIYEEQRKKERYVSQIAFYKMLEEQYSQMERLRHDMKNHVIALRGLLGNQEWEAMENYLMRMMESGSLEEEEDVTWSRGVNALLYEKRRLAEEGGVRWSCDVNLPKEFHVEEFDLCVLFGNMLDNALEACGRMDEKKEKWIDIQSGTVKKCFLIEIRNSMEEEKPDKMKKENPEWHGTGLNNIADTVKRYDGVVNIEMQEGVFMISVLLPLKV